ncbi:MAG: arylformamidase [Candidatus Azotimanducaceae bacterium]
MTLNTVGQLVKNRHLLGKVILGLIFITANTAFAENKPIYQVDSNLYYGDTSKPDRELQSLDVYWQDNQESRPVIIYVHGGGWAFGDKSEVNLKPDFFLPQGFAFVSMNYRLRWDYKLYDQAEDLASVVRWVRDNANQYGFDKNKIILMGHESGAHLVSLVGTDGRYLKTQGLSLAHLKAVVSINTLSYDVPRVLKELGTFVQRRQHKLIFGEDKSVQLQASPIHHVKDNKNIPPFALLYVPDNESTLIQAKAFAKSLSEQKVNVVMIPGNAKTKQTLDVELGKRGDISTIALIAFLRAAL